jgi:hypothetical protein
MTTTMRTAAVVTVLVWAGAASAPADSAHAARAGGVPRTLAQAATVGARPVRSARPIDFLGVLWRGARRDGGAVRFRRATGWSRWLPLHLSDVQPRAGAAAELVAAQHTSAYQVRPPDGARDVRAVAINTTDGPPQPAATRPAGTAGDVLGWSGLCYRSRAAWGADESLRLDPSGTPRETPQYFPVQRLTVHHTVIDDPADPAAAVRAIYRYHTVDLGWADIGYQLLVDAQGCIYEGRWSGTDPIPVYDGLPLPGVPPGAVNGAHVLGFNVGNVGVALLGDFDRAEPAAAALRSLTFALTGLAVASGLDPEGYGTYVNPVTGASKDTYVIGGHRDWLATACPGELLYPRLPELRERVAALVGLLRPGYATGAGSPRTG